MFADRFLPNALIAVAGFATAIFWLRTGMVRRGVLLLWGLAVAADVALVARFVFSERAEWFFAGLWSMQAAALVACVWLVGSLVRRRWSADARRIDPLFAAAFQHYLRDELGPARDLLRRILRTDPWHVAATIALANVHWRQGRLGPARDLLLRARRLDRSRGFGDLVAEQLRRVAAGPPRRRPAPGERSQGVGGGARPAAFRAHPL